MLEFATAITVSVNGKIKPNPHEAPNFVGVEGSVSMFHRQTPPRNTAKHELTTNNDHNYSQMPLRNNNEIIIAVT